MLVSGIFSVTKMHKAEHINLYKHTKLDLLAKIFAKTLDLQVNLCYNIDRNKDRGQSPKHERMVTMKRYFKTVDNKLIEISKDEADAMEKRNNELFASGDFSKMLEIEIPLVIEQ